MKNSNRLFYATIKLERNSNLFELVAFADEIGTVHVKGIDYFDCFQRFRKQVETEKLKCLCQGARPNVWPSSMARQMSDGLKAYELTIGEPTSRDDLVEIFAEATEEQVAPLEEQLAFFEAWKQSFKNV